MTTPSRHLTPTSNTPIHSSPFAFATHLRTMATTNSREREAKAALKDGFLARFECAEEAKNSILASEPGDARIKAVNKLNDHLVCLYS